MRNRLALIALFVFIPIFAYPQAHMNGRQAMREAGTPFYHVDLNRFPTTSQDSMEVILFVKVPYDNLQFVKFDTSFQAEYEISIVAFDKDGIQIDSKIEQHTIDVPNFELTNANDLYDQSRYAFTLHNNVYKFSVGLMDLDTRKTTYRKHTVDLMKSNKENLRMSDLLLVDQKVDPDTSKGTFVPNVMNKLDSKQEELFGYFTLAGTEGPAYIEASILKSDGEEVLQTVQDTVQVSQEPVEKFVRMQTQDMNYSKYIFRVNVSHDGEEITRNKEFRVAWVGLTDFVANLDKAIEQMIYVMSVGDVNRMKKLPPEEKKKAFMDYWKKRDPTPRTEANELMNEYYRRATYADQEFGSSLKDGWRTDMGMVYILFGAPNDIERHPFDIGSKPYQIWYYWEINRQLVFVDETGFGDYRLVTPIHDLYSSPF